MTGRRRVLRNPDPLLVGNLEGDARTVRGIQRQINEWRVAHGLPSIDCSGSRYAAKARRWWRWPR